MMSGQRLSSIPGFGPRAKSSDGVTSAGGDMETLARRLGRSTRLTRLDLSGLWQGEGWRERRRVCCPELAWDLVVTRALPFVVSTDTGPGTGDLTRVRR